MRVTSAVVALTIILAGVIGIGALWFYCLGQLVEHGPELAGQIAARVHRAYRDAQP